MKYSYIKPRKKSVFTPEFKLLFTFFSITIFMLMSTYLFLLFKDYRFDANKREILQKRSDLNVSIVQMKEQIRFIEVQKLLAEKVYTQNSVLKESIMNLFDLVPERITLSKASLLENGLILYGVTPNKDVYNFMLQAPLRSIFHKTYSSFYPAENGWFRFVSTNYIQDDSMNTPQIKEKGDLDED
jgi:hypothetical protein